MTESAVHRHIAILTQVAGQAVIDRRPNRVTEPLYIEIHADDRLYLPAQGAGD